jgi:hypothetical protein
MRAEFYLDEEANNWHFRVPALHIIGGGTTTRADAEAQCLDAVAFALEGNPDEYDNDAQAVALEVSLEVSSPAA